MRRAETFRRLFDARWTPEPNTGCWLWTGATASAGYGVCQYRCKQIRAHRLAWLFYRGAIPNGMVLDHVCRVRSCVNPDHLRIVTRAVNTLENSVGITAQNAKKTHCKHGHSFSGKNLLVARPNAPGQRARRGCRACRVLRKRSARTHRQRQAALR